MLEKLKREVWEANLQLPRSGLVLLTWGNVSGIDRDRGLIVIKPSGVSYDVMTQRDMIVADMDGRVVDGVLRPSSDLPTHLELYKAWPEIGGVVHTHSRWATIFAQLGRDVPTLGTTHADYFFGDIPCTRPMTGEEVEADYERQTGRVIVERFAGLSAESIPAALVRSHGPFTWGGDASKAVENAVVLEELAFMAWHGLALEPKLRNLPCALLDRHYRRKHGVCAYYGQGR